MNERFMNEMFEDYLIATGRLDPDDSFELYVRLSDVDDNVKEILRRAEEGDADAQYEMGMRFRVGDGVFEDEIEVFQVHPGGPLLPLGGGLLKAVVVHEMDGHGFLAAPQQTQRIGEPRLTDLLDLAAQVVFQTAREAEEVLVLEEEVDRGRQKGQTQVVADDARDAVVGDQGKVPVAQPQPPQAAPGLYKKAAEPAGESPSPALSHGNHALPRRAGVRPPPLPARTQALPSEPEASLCPTVDFESASSLSYLPSFFRGLFTEALSERPDNPRRP